MPKQNVELLRNQHQRLKQVAQDLITGRAVPERIAPVLHQINAELDEFKCCEVVPGSEGELRILLSKVRRETARVQKLLDSAAAFYSGVFLALSRPEQSYRADGSLYSAIRTASVSVQA